MCHAPDALFTHAHLMRIFTLDYMGGDLDNFKFGDVVKIGTFRDTHDQYTYDAEKRCVYPQMMLNYLLDGLDLVAHDARTAPPSPELAPREESEASPSPPTLPAAAAEVATEGAGEGHESKQSLLDANGKLRADWRRPLMPEEDPLPEVLQESLTAVACDFQTVKDEKKARAERKASPERQASQSFSTDGPGEAVRWEASEASPSAKGATFDSSDGWA